MTEENRRGVEVPTSEMLATSGLVTMLGTVVAAVMSVGALCQGSVATAGALGAVTVFSFVASVVCFAADSNRTDDAPLPFPSWLRTEPETAVELSAGT